MHTRTIVKIVDTEYELAFKRETRDRSKTIATITSLDGKGQQASVTVSEEELQNSDFMDATLKELHSDITGQQIYTQPDAIFWAKAATLGGHAYGCTRAQRAQIADYYESDPSGMKASKYINLVTKDTKGGSNHFIPQEKKMKVFTPAILGFWPEKLTQRQISKTAVQRIQSILRETDGTFSRTLANEILGATAIKTMIQQRWLEKNDDDENYHVPAPVKELVLKIDLNPEPRKRYEYKAAMA